jgi:hypothetical protein
MHQSKEKEFLGKIDIRSSSVGKSIQQEKKTEKKKIPLTTAYTQLAMLQPE